MSVGEWRWSARESYARLAALVTERYEALGANDRSGFTWFAECVIDLYERSRGPSEVIVRCRDPTIGTPPVLKPVAIQHPQKRQTEFGYEPTMAARRQRRRRQQNRIGDLRVRNSAHRYRPSTPVLCGRLVVAAGAL